MSKKQKAIGVMIVFTFFFFGIFGRLGTNDAAEME